MIKQKGQQWMNVLMQNAKIGAKYATLNVVVMLL